MTTPPTVAGCTDIDFALDLRIQEWDSHGEIQEMFTRLVLEDDLNFLSREEFWRRYLWRYWKLKGEYSGGEAA